MKTSRGLIVALIGSLITVYPGRAETVPDPGVHRLLSMFSAYTDLRMQSVHRSLAVLAATAEARSGDWEAIQSLLSGYQATDPGLAAWFMLPDGTYFTAEKGRMDVTLADRAYYPDLAAGRTVHGALVVSKSTGHRSAIIAVPVMDGDKMVAAVGASVFLDVLSDTLSAILDPPEGASFFALAPDGLTALHSRKDRHFLDPRELGNESLKQAAEWILQTSDGDVRYEFEGIPKRAYYRATEPMAWRYVITTSDPSPPAP